MGFLNSLLSISGLHGEVVSSYGSLGSAKRESAPAPGESPYNVFFGAILPEIARSETGDVFVRHGERILFLRRDGEKIGSIGISDNPGHVVYTGTAPDEHVLRVFEKYGVTVRINEKADY